MNSFAAYSPKTRGSAALGGAAVGAGLTLAYALLFILYAVLRSAITILAVQPSAALLAANSISLIIPSLSIAVLVSFFAAGLGALTAVLVRWLLPRFNPRCQPLRAAAIGLGTALGLGLLLQLALQLGTGLSIFSLQPETALFWFGLPGLVYAAAGAVGAEISCGR